MRLLAQQTTDRDLINDFRAAIQQHKGVAFKDGEYASTEEAFQKAGDAQADVGRLLAMAGESMGASLNDREVEEELEEALAAMAAAPEAAAEKAGEAATPAELPPVRGVAHLYA